MGESFQRARNPEQKKERMLEIMNATDELFHENCYQQVTLTTIAEKLGWARGNLYKYVKTKEDIFLALYLQKQQEVMDDLEIVFKGKEDIDNKTFGELYTSSLIKNMDYLKYHRILSAIVETNVSVETLASFKKQSYQSREAAYQLLSKQCPDLDSNEVKQLYLSILYQACGLYSHTEFSDTYVEAMALAKMPINYAQIEESLPRFISMCLDNAHNE